MASGHAAMALEEPLVNAIHSNDNDDILHIDETSWKERTMPIRLAQADIWLNGTRSGFA